MTTLNDMRIKSYFARSVEQAIAQARQELGEDALLLNTRKVPAQGGFRGGYEVTFGLDETPASAENVERALPEIFPQIEPVKLEPEFKAVAEFKAAPAPETSSRRELEALRTQMEEIRSLLVGSVALAGRRIPELADVYARLTAAEWDSGIVREIVDRLEASLANDAFLPGRFSPARLERFVRAELDERVSLDTGSGNAIAVVGPTGAGKTTTLMKIAAMRTASGAPVRILTLDVSSGWSRLEGFAEKTAVTVTPVPSPDLLPALIAEARKRETVLIDTPGYFGDAAPAARYFSKCDDLDVHLVVPAYMRSGDLGRCIQRYKAFKPSRLLVTKLDETEVLGPVVSEAVKAKLSLSFLTHGPSVAGEIRAAEIGDLVVMALGREAARAECA